MAFTPAQASTLFDILLEKGNHHTKPGSGKEAYAPYWREEFINSHTKESVFEHWYPTHCGTSMKLYYTFGALGTFKVVSHIQGGYNSIHEKTLATDLQEALDNFSNEEYARATGSTA